MTAKGKVNASNVQINDRIIVKVSSGGTVRPSDTKTGEGIQVARVIGKSFRSAQGRYESRGKYIIETTSGSFGAAPIQTMWLAPEDPAGIKRARVEAEAEDIARDAVKATAGRVERAAQDEERWTNGAIVDAEEAAYAQDAARTATEDLTLHSQACNVDSMNNASDTENGPIDKAAITAKRIDSLMNSGVTQPTALDASSELAQSLVQADHEEALKAENHTGSTVVRLLEKVWARIREDHPELPEVVIITGSGLLGGSKWGHFRPDGWKIREEGSARKHELFLAGEALAKGARQVLQTMLHEGAHTLARVRDIQDTSRQGRWHNAEFRKLAGEMGLDHKGSQANSSHGFSFVTLTPDTTARYADLLKELDREILLTCHLPVWMGGTEDEESGDGEKITGKPTSEGKKSGNVKATCTCDDSIIVRISQKVLDLGVVRCDDCGSLFLDRS